MIRQGHVPKRVGSHLERHNETEEGLLHFQVGVWVVLSPEDILYHLAEPANEGIPEVFDFSLGPEAARCVQNMSLDDEVTHDLLCDGG